MAEEALYDDVTRDQLREDLLRVADKLNKTPSIENYNEHGDHSHNTLIKYLEGGKWTEICESVGLRPNNVTREDYIDLPEESITLSKALDQLSDHITEKSRKYVYTIELYAPETNEKFVYVGKTSRPLVRMSDHILEGGDTDELRDKNAVVTNIIDVQPDTSISEQNRFDEAQQFYQGGFKYRRFPPSDDIIVCGGH